MTAFYIPVVADKKSAVSMQRTLNILYLLFISGDTISGLFLAEHLPSQYIVCHDPDKRQEEPSYREYGAYLSQNIERQPFVVPYIPAKPDVYYASADKFKHGYYHGGYQHLDRQGVIFAGVDTSHQHKAYPS